MIVPTLAVAIIIYAWLTLTPGNFALAIHRLFFSDVPFDSDESDEKIGGVIYYVHMALHIVITVLAFYAGVEYATP